MRSSFFSLEGLRRPRSLLQLPLKDSLGIALHKRTPSALFHDGPPDLRTCSGYNTKFKLHYGDLTDSTNLVYISSVCRAEVYWYNLGVQLPTRNTRATLTLGTLRLLDAIRMCGFEKVVRF